MIEQVPAGISEMTSHVRILVSCALVVSAYLVDFLCCRILVPLIQKVAVRTAFKWDNYLTDSKVLHNVFHLVPPVTFYVALPLLFPGPSLWTDLLLKVFAVYIIVVACRLVCEFITSLYAISADSEVLKDKPMKGVYQMLKVVVVCICAILVIGVLMEKDFTSLIAGLGASAAVLMLVFKDTILGVVAGVQLSAHDMLRPGDWIMMDKYGINGTVEEVTLNTVKVRNWDKTVTTVPPYVLVSDSFKNWRGMRESAGRRVSRAIRIDMNSIRFCTQDELDRLRKDIPLMGDYAPAEGQTPTNSQVYRVYIERYLMSLPVVNQDLDLIIAQKEPTEHGLPIRVYFFSRIKAWREYERIQSDIFDHLLAMAPRFGLKLYQGI